MATPRRKTPNRRLLILACSSRKLTATGLLPAVERYDGVAFRVIKRLKRLDQYPKDVDLLIVSAKYGVIPHDHPIPPYDVRMTLEVAAQQAKQNATLLRKTAKDGRYGEIFVSAGKVYLLALEPFDVWRGSTPVTINKGRIGVQLKALKDWLLRVSNGRFSRRNCRDA